MNSSSISASYPISQKVLPLLEDVPSSSAAQNFVLEPEDMLGCILQFLSPSDLLQKKPVAKVWVRTIASNHLVFRTLTCVLPESKEGFQGYLKYSALGMPMQLV